MKCHLFLDCALFLGELLCCRIAWINMLWCAFLSYERPRWPWWKRKEDSTYSTSSFIRLFSSVHYIERSVSSLKLPETTCLCVSVCVGVRWHTNAPANLQRTHTHRFRNLNTEAFRGAKSPPIDWSCGYHSEGRETHQIFNTQQTYQPLTAEYGLGHLPWKCAHIYWHKQAMGAYCRDTHCSAPAYAC